MHALNLCTRLAVQAMDRAHRLGQRRTVNVYRLLVSHLWWAAGWGG